MAEENKTTGTKGRKPKEQVEEQVVTTNDDTLKLLMAQIAELKSQVESKDKEKTDMEKLIDALKTSNKGVDDGEITSDTEIKVISQYVGKLSLFTDGNGQGTPYRFYNFGEIQDIPYGDLKDIVKNNRSFSQIPYFYIANEEAVKKLRLKKFYDVALSNDDMLNLLQKDDNTIVELYRLAPERQKQVIIDLVLDNKETLGYNILVLLSAECGKKLTD